MHFISLVTLSLRRLLARAYLCTLYIRFEMRRGEIGALFCVGCRSILGAKKTKLMGSDQSQQYLRCEIVVNKI